MCDLELNLLFSLGRHLVKVSENKAIDNCACLRVQLKTRAGQRCAHPRSQFAHSYAIDVFFFDFSVPVVQRTEQGFPKGKTPLLHKSADVVSCAQIAAIEPVELLLGSSRVISNLHIFTHPGDTKGDTKTNVATTSFLRAFRFGTCYYQSSRIPHGQSIDQTCQRNIRSAGRKSG